jgi:hypothetical protein
LAASRFPVCVYYCTKTFGENCWAIHDYVPTLALELVNRRDRLVELHIIDDLFE